MRAEAISDYLTLLRSNGIPNHCLNLKVGAVCTIMRNLSIDKGLVKNARVIIQAMHRHSIQVSLCSDYSPNNGSIGAQQDTWVPIPRILFEFNPGYVPWTIERRQFPLRLAYAVTYNSCQGLTLDRVVIDIRVDPFAHGQLYTALTRVRNRSHCRVLFGEKEKATVKNIVYKSLLL
ncbi:hypothetical protein BJ508DRAFT_377315 [Ascobolus immersus RN42]|uniref:DNA helicase Pif1-like 2B domain-containing protein n=1 Tax=Ascobolus immersus RN42 TaxID=1160509 RepID=A0A3N4I7L4_ASCIM|nr:hypothetical protein BJ508DRAFT_377315 [Ascobolus immersus RN42]